MDQDISSRLQEQVRSAAADGQQQRIVGGDSKRFYGRNTDAAALNAGDHCGILSHQPTELVLSARAGTRLRDIDAALAGSGQMLAFEPPGFGARATLGGTIACGLSGPRRPWAGAARDFVLGCKLLNGRGEILSFGGEVMKNVAGYDVSRLMTGAMGTLGVLLEISLKVLPRPEEEVTLVLDMDAGQSIETMNRLAGQPLPLSAMCHDDTRLYLRLSGSGTAVRAARESIGGSQLPEGFHFWEDLREHRLPFFHAESPLWRLSLAPGTQALQIPGNWLLDWGGAQRWLVSDAPPAAIRTAAAAAGGHATLFRGGNRSGEVFHPLPPTLGRLHAGLKQAFDPEGILNPGRMYPDW